METRNEQPINIALYRGGLSDNTSGKVVRIDFRSCDQVRKFIGVVSALADGQCQSVELSDTLKVNYEPNVSGFILRLRPRQRRDNIVTVKENRAASIEWEATADVWLGVLEFLEKLSESSGGHQYLTSGSDGVEIVAAHYK